MDFELIKQILIDIGAPHSDETIALFEQIENARNDAEFIKNQPSIDEILKKINEVKEKSFITQKKIDIYKQKIHSISQILSLFVIKQEKYNHDIFKRRCDKYKALRNHVDKLVAESREKLNQKPKINPNMPSYKLSQKMKDAIQEYIDSKDKLNDKQEEESLFNHTTESNLYALLDTVKDLNFACKLHDMNITPFDQTQFISQILGL